MIEMPQIVRRAALLQFLLLLWALAIVRAQPLSQLERATDNPYLSYYNPSLIKPDHRVIETDICIYGGTSAGVAAAVQARRQGKRVVVLEPGGHLGGLSSGGLSSTDIGNKQAIGGISREFYRRLGKKYGKDEEWRFEPHVAEQVFNEMVEEAGVPVFFYQFCHSVLKEGGRITQLRTMSGLTVHAKMFIDATYEGDLVAFAGVSYRVGRESNDTYGETLNGFQQRDKHQFEAAIDPYVVAGSPASGLLPGIIYDDDEAPGQGDRRIQAYTFRLCLTKDPDKRIPFPKPRNYDPQRYELLARYLATGWNKVFGGFGAL